MWDVSERKALRGVSILGKIAGQERRVELKSLFAVVKS